MKTYYNPVIKAFCAKKQKGFIPVEVNETTGDIIEIDERTGLKKIQKNGQSSIAKVEIKKGMFADTMTITNTADNSSRSVGLLIDSNGNKF